MIKHFKNTKTKLLNQINYSLFLVTSFILIQTTNIYAAEDVWTKASSIMKDLYSKIVGISTISAIVCAAIALILMNFSKAGKTVDESRAWLKRIAITWAILNGLGFIMAYVTPLFQGGQYTP